MYRPFSADPSLPKWGRILLLVLVLFSTLLRLLVFRPIDSSNSTRLQFPLRMMIEVIYLGIRCFPAFYPLPEDVYPPLRGYGLLLLRRCYITFPTSHQRGERPYCKLPFWMKIATAHFRCICANWTRCDGCNGTALLGCADGNNAFYFISREVAWRWCLEGGVTGERDSLLRVLIGLSSDPWHV